MRLNKASFVATFLAVWVLAIAPCTCAEPKDLCHSEHCDCSFCPDCLQISSEKLILLGANEPSKDVGSFNDSPSIFTNTAALINQPFYFSVGLYHHTTVSNRKISFAKLERGPPIKA